MACEDLSITKVTNIEGEVSVNQRKGRVKQLFDLEISFEYKKTVDGSSGTGFISDFTADYEDTCDLNLKLTPRIENIGNVLKAVGEVIKAFKTELHEIHGKPLLLEASQTVDTCPNAESGVSSVSETVVAKPSSVPKPSQSAQTPQITTTTTIEDEVTFPCQPDQLYLMLTDASRIRSWTRASSTIPQILLPGAFFTLFDGNIICKFVALKSPERIEMEWKLRAWSLNSNVVIDLCADKQGGQFLK